MSSQTKKYDAQIRNWMERPENSAENEAERIKKLESFWIGTAATLRQQGCSQDELINEMREFEAAGRRYLASADVSDAKQPAQSREASHERLGFLSWAGAVLLSFSLAASSTGFLYTLAEPLLAQGRFDRLESILAASIVGFVVFVAGVLFSVGMVRHLRDHDTSTAFFWLPAIFVSNVLGPVSIELAREATESLGADYLPLALPVTVAVGLTFLLLATGTIVRHFLAKRHHGELESSREPGPLFMLLAGVLSVAFFATGAQVLLGWGSGPSVVIGFLITGLIARFLPEEREINFLYVPLVAVPLALLAIEMPPSSLSALTIMLLALGTGLVVKLVLWPFSGNGARTTLFSSLTAAALALLLVIAPLQPSPAMQAASYLGHPLAPASHWIMNVYGDLYATDYGRAALIAIGGFRNASASVAADSISYDETSRQLELVASVTNNGEQGVELMVLILADQRDSTSPCGGVEIEHRFEEPLWPGDRALMRLRWTAPASCSAADANALGNSVAEGIRNLGWGAQIRNRVTAIRKVDPGERFQQDAKGWLGL